MLRFRPRRLGGWRHAAIIPLVAMALAPAVRSVGDGPRSSSFPVPDDTEPLAQSSADDFVPLTPADDAAASMTFSLGEDRSDQHANDFNMRVLASEPQVRNPIDIAWDSRGRLWVAENYTYARRELHFRDDLRDRVIVLTDTDLDGQVDDRQVFIDTVDKLTSVEIGRGGVWLMAPPRLLFVPFANVSQADVVLKPDGPARVVLDGFTVADQNYHNFANGLRFGPDGWLYGRCGGSCPGRVGKPGTPDDQRTAIEWGIWRYNVDTEHFEVICHGTTNPWGHDFNEVGELFFINTVNGHLWHAIAGAHFKRPFTLDPNAMAYELIDQHADHYHFDTGKSWTASRHGAASDFGGGHAHSGMMIYQDKAWPPSLRGDLFTCNFHGRRINREHLTRRGTGYVGTHGPDFMQAADPWFRGMELSAGPDGCVVVADWSDLGECHEHTGVHRNSGRLYRITPSAERYAESESSRAVLNRLERLNSDIDLARFIISDRRWFSHQARLRLTELARTGKDVSAEIQVLNNHFRDTTTPTAERLRCLWTLDAVDATNVDEMLHCWRHDPSEAVRVWALRLLTQHWPIDDCYGRTTAGRQALNGGVIDRRVLEAVITHHSTAISSPLVIREMASTLQRLPEQSRSEIAATLAAEGDFANDHNLPLLIWYGVMNLADDDPRDLLQIARASQLPMLTRLLTRAITERMDTHPGVMDGLLHTASMSRDSIWLDAFLTGMREGLVGVPRCEPSGALDDFMQRMNLNAELAAKHSDTLAALARVYGEGQSVETMLSIMGDASINPLQRASAAEGLIAAWHVGRQVATTDDLARFLRQAESLIRDPRINVRVSKAAFQLNSNEANRTLSEMVVKHLRRFRAPRRAGALMLLCSRVGSADVLLSAMERNQIDSSMVTATHARTIVALNDEDLTSRLEATWGSFRTTPSERTNEMARLKNLLTRSRLFDADLSEGRALFEKNCSACHQLFESGGKVGPNLTGAQRDNLDYWLDNIVDPDSVVSADYRATQILTTNGRLLVGLVTETNRQFVKLVAADQTWNIPMNQIEDRRQTDQSPMPSGLLTPLDDQQITNLVGYLMHPVQVSAN
ncbi:MAG: PVC-type heme-binding CxxCH protein [Planctomycetota bacterium]